MNGVELNQTGLELFGNGQPIKASNYLEQAYKDMPKELGILVNLGLAYMQQKQVKKAEKCYQMALQSENLLVRRSASKNLGFLLLWNGNYNEGWYWHGKRFEGEELLKTQWKGEPLNGRLLTVWNDVGIGDAFQFARYTLPLIQRKEKVRIAVDSSQINLFKEELAWELTDVVDRGKIDHLDGNPQIPLMNLIPIIDPTTEWGRNFESVTWKKTTKTEKNSVGVCWSSNPNDKTMHYYKSITSEQIMDIVSQKYQIAEVTSLQTDEVEEHQRLKLKPAMKNWYNTLNKIKQCREIISVDTAVAHLAAGCGEKTTVLLSDPPDWRWKRIGKTISTGNWYPNIKIESIK